MSAAVLRAAARLMRERAEAATPGPWRFTDSEAVNDVWDGGMVVVSDEADPIANVRDEWYENDPGEPAPLNDAEHIASWNPAVALAVAKAMDDVALAWEICDGWTRDMDDDEIRFEHTVDGGWLNVARAYLGAES